MGTEFWCFFWMCAFCCQQSDSKIIDHSKKPMKRYRIRVVWAFGLFLPFKKDIEGNQTWEYLHMIHVFLSSNGYQPNFYRPGPPFEKTSLAVTSRRPRFSCKFCTRRRSKEATNMPFLTFSAYSFSFWRGVSPETICLTGTRYHNGSREETWCAFQGPSKVHHTFMASDHQNVMIFVAEKSGNWVFCSLYFTSSSTWKKKLLETN